MMKKCPNGHEVGDNMNFCPTCGAEITDNGARFCSKCGNERKGTEKFCSQCGTPFETSIDNEPIMYEEEETENGFKKYLPYIIGAVILLGIIGYYSLDYFQNRKEVNSIVTDTVSVDTTATVDSTQIYEQEIKAKKDFIEKFYKGLDSSDFDDAYIRKHITANAKRILNEKYDYDCDGDCLAVWLFAYEGGSDTGEMISRTITEQEDNNFVVETKYASSTYKVKLTVIKVGDTYKIDDIEQMNDNNNSASSDYSSSSDENLNNEDNSTSSSRTFANEQYVTMYLANQTFRSNDGFTIRFDGDLRMYAEGDFAGVVSVLNYNSTSAMLRYGGGQYTEGRFRVDIVGNKLQLTDPADGSVFYQR